MYTSKYFAQKEFACKCGCGFGTKPEDIAPDIYFALHILRAKLQIPFKLTSAARCLKHNQSVNGGLRSTHLAGVSGDCTPDFAGKCRAVDVDTIKWSTAQRGEAIAMAHAMGLRVGIATTFLHFDCESEPYYREGVWNYGANESSSI
jgi:hypothetical protein